ncbi:MAG: trypsin-like peptidase domain-containing protein [Propionibacteriales bacterium]|nr:trypsin-like peptidase domain-containing protein [Propionibacteriales bacterium]
MSDTGNDEPTTPLGEVPSYLPPGAAYPVPPSPAPEQPAPEQPAAYPNPYGLPVPAAPYGEPGPYGPPSPYGHPGQHVQHPQHVSAPTSRVPGWIWPVVAVVSLVIGIVGGVIGGALVNQVDNDNVGVLQVERRTAAPLADDNQSVPSVAEKVLPSTVKIVAEFKGAARGAAGSGWVFDNEGHVITNNHVVAEAASDDGPIDVIDHLGKHHKATVVGRSPVYDLAVLKVEGIKDLPAAALGSADQMHVGETVVAVGSPLALSASVTSGIISAVDRPVTTGDGDEASFINAIQTDAAINPGNSGGPLANLQGQVIGVNSALATLGTAQGEEGTNIGIGFAIPIEQVQITADQILRTGKAQYPIIGVSVKGAAADEGAEVTAINDGTPAARSGLRVGDLITAVDGRPVTDQTDVVVAIRSHRVTDKVKLTVIRDGRTLTIEVGLLAKTG